MTLEFVSRPLSEFIRPEEFGLFYHIITDQTVSIGIRNGGWIAGGFARTILAGESIVDYIWPERRRDVDFPGDIDIFFPDAVSAKNANEDATANFRSPKFNTTGRFATDWLLRPNRLTRNYATSTNIDENRINEVKIQYVTNPPDGFKRTLIDTISDFDLVNCMVGFDGERIVFPKKWFELQEFKVIEINKSSTPFLGRRLAKYLMHRNYNAITHASKDLLIEWVARVKNDEWPSIFNAEHTRKQMMMRALDQLLSSGDISLADIVILLNKWTISKKVATDGYGQTRHIQVDWALDKIENRVEIV